MSARAVARSVAVLLLLAGIVGCDRAEDSSRRYLPDRFARKYVPFEPDWVSEDRIPMGPPRSPQMVIWEVSEFDPRIPATPAQQKAGDDFVERCFEVAREKGWFDRPKGMADGFLTPGTDSRHHRNDKYVLDGIQLDPERPEFLMYYADPNRKGEKALTGFMFLADGKESRGHQFAGPLAIWHYHKYTNARCWAGQGLLSTGMIDAQGKCQTGIPRNRSPEMVHVWLIEHPRGPFSTGMTLPSNVLKTGLAKRWETFGY
jgi:hypothetical protein